MELSWKQIIESLLAPILAAQIFMTVLIYFSIVRKRLTANYKGYVTFLVVFILFLIGRPLQQYYQGPFYENILYLRMFLLFAVGIPALLISAAVQCGFAKSRKLTVMTFGTGLFFALLYCVAVGIAWGRIPVDPETRDLLRFTERLAHKIQIAGAAVMLMFPMGYLMIREFRGARNPKQMAFLFGAFLFGAFVVFASMQPQTLGWFYIGSVFSALCWSWAVFRDVRDMKGRTALLKDELQALAQRESSGPEMEKLLLDLEKLSEGNQAVYKMRLREILSRLTDAKIEAGGDSEALVLRNAERAHDIEASTNSEQLREIVKTEAAALSELISEKKNVTVEKARAYIHEHFDRDLGVDEIADELGISKAHLMREFKKETGKTVNQFITGLRIEKAKELLAENSVTDTAFEVGYNDPNYFSTVFKKHTGQTPGQFKTALNE